MAHDAPRGGIDLGGTKIEAIIVDATNTVLGSARRPTPTTGGPADVASEMITALKEAADAAGVALNALAGVGVGSPGLVDSAGGTVRSADNLPGWHDSFALAATLRDAFGVPVKLGNDVRVATEAEMAIGAGRPYRSLLGVFWGTGVGGGLVLDGVPWAGRGAGGEIGHTVIKEGGRRCPCGRRGCLEAYAGRAAMEARARRLADRGRHTDLFEIMRAHDRTRLTSAIWAHAVEHGDALATRLINRAIEAIGVGIASAVNLLDVEAVLIGGGLGVRFGDAYVERIRAAMTVQLLHPERPPAVHLVGLGDLGGALGAALLVNG